MSTEYPQPGHPAVGALLAAAAAPGLPRELAGEQACLAAFRAAGAARPARRRPLSTIRRAVVKVLTVKAAIAALATTAVGGLALAAGTPIGPDAGHRDPLHPVPAPIVRSSPVETGSGYGGPARTGAASTPDGEPALVGLCQAYQAGNKAIRGKALDSPAFSALVAAAGGRDRVDGYCAGAGPPTPQEQPAGEEHPETPGRADKEPHPSEHPGHPTGKPTEHPGH